MEKKSGDGVSDSNKTGKESLEFEPDLDQPKSGDDKEYLFDTGEAERVIQDKIANMKERIEHERRKRKERNGEITPLSSSEEDDGDEDEELSTPARSRSPSPTIAPRQPPPQSKTYASASDMLQNAVVNLFTLTCGVLVFGIFLVGSYDYFRNVEGNKCEMTWMYHVPFYVPISMNVNPEEKDKLSFPMYKLYAYAEGEPAAEAISRKGHRFTGIPVLYIPGNAGSYQQVRSLASVALWKHLDSGTHFHFDFFSVDLNEEFSALYGYTLQRQVQFVREAVIRIQNLYEEYHKVVLVGHSMGGVIAKAVALDQSSEEGNYLLSDLILTLATPHQNPVIILDPELDIFYMSLLRKWTTRSEETSRISVVSVAGGERDFLVFPKLTRWPNSTHTITTGIPGVWASTDHLCIVWCKQLVLTTIRALFDLVEFNQRNKYYHITDKEDLRKGVLKYHFVERSGGKSYHGMPKQSINILSKNLEQVEVISSLHCTTGGQRGQYAMFSRKLLLQNLTTSLSGSADGDSTTLELERYNLIVLTTNTKEKNWIMGCVERLPNGQCSQAESLAQMGKVIPHIRRRRKMATVPMSLFSSKYSDLVIKMDSYPFKTCVMLEVYDRNLRTGLLGGEFGADQKIFYNLTIIPTGLLSYLAAWKVTAEPNNMTCPESHNLLAQFQHGQFEQSRFLKNESLLVRHVDWNVSSSSVQVYLEPSCNYTVKTALAPMETAGQFFRLVIRMLPSFCASVILMSLYFQKDPEEWSSFHMVLLGHAYHLTIFPGFFAAVLLHFVPTDWPTMVEGSEFSVVIPIICYLIAYCLVMSISTGTWYAIITGGTALHSVFIRVISTRFGSWIPRILSNHRGFTSVTEHVTEAAFEMTLTRFPLTIALVLLCISFSTCGSLGIALALALYVVKLFKIYEDLLEDLLKAKIANVTGSLSPMNFHFCCYMLWLVLTAFNVPSLLHWCRSHSSEVAPQWDLSMYLCLLLLPTVAILWQDFVPKMEPTIWKLHRYVFYAMGMVCILWGTHRLYVTAFIITFVFLTMAVCQLVSVMMNYITRNDNSSNTTNATDSSTSASEQNAPSSAPSPPQQQPETAPGSTATYVTAANN